MKISILQHCRPSLPEELLQSIEKYGTLSTFKNKEFIVRQGQQVHHLPIVLEGHIKVYSDEADMQFLLYYIYPGEGCIFSFSQLTHQKKAEFSAQAMEEVTLIMLPSEQVELWIKKYPSFIKMILQNYQKHYKDLLETTKQVTCYRLEERLVTYLEKRSAINQSVLLPLSHQEIATDLGTSREVVSRLLKKISKSHNVTQIGRSIKIG